MRIHRFLQAKNADPRNSGGADRALTLARSLTNLAASPLHGPPVSMPTTTKRQRSPARSSWYLRSLSPRARARTMPSVVAVPTQGNPWAVSALRTLCLRATSRATPSSFAQRGCGVPLRLRTEHNRGVDRELRSMRQREPVRHDLEPSLVHDIWMGEVHVLHTDVHGDSGPSFTTHTSCRAFNHKPLRPRTPAVAQAAR